MKKLLLITFCLSAISALAASTTEVRFQTNAFNHAASGVGVRVDAGSTVGDTIAAATNGTVASAATLANANLPVPTNSPSANARMVATSDSTTAWQSGEDIVAGSPAIDMTIRDIVEFSTNATFAFILPSGISDSKAQTARYAVTNSSGSLISVTAPQNMHTQGTWNITNVTVFTFYNHKGLYTNGIAHPLW